MALTQSQIIARVNRKIHNAKGKIGGDNEMQDILNEALRDLRLDVDLVSAKRTSPNFLIFSNIFEYPLAPDIDYDKAIVFHPQDESKRGTFWERIDSNYFFNVQNSLNQEQAMWPRWNNWNSNQRIESNPNKYSVTFENADPYLLLRTSLGDFSDAGIGDTSSVMPTNGGTWVASNDATNLRTDTQRYKTQSSSLAFDSLGVGSSVTITNSTFTPVNLSNMVNEGVFTLWLDSPITVPNSVTIQVGSSAANYWTGTVTTRFTSLPFHQGWNLLGFFWETMTQVGAPDSTMINYFQITATNTTPILQLGYHLDDVMCHLGKELTLDYYSKFLVLTNLGVRQEAFSLPSDMIILEGQEVNLLVDLAAKKASEELREWDEAKIQNEIYTMKRDKNLERRPSESALESTSYYLL